MKQATTTLLALVLVVLVALICWGALATAQSILQPTPAPFGLATQVQNFFNPTPTVYPSKATVILQIQSLARLETARYTIEKVVTAETGQGALATLFGDRLLFVAHGRVTAGVDLSKLREEDIIVSENGDVTIIMPAAEIFDSALDEEKSYVYDRQTGVFTKGDKDLERQARIVAAAEIRKAAEEDGITRLAQQNAETFLDRLLRSLRYTNVRFIIATPMPQPTP